jgi:hypothetical protein
MPFELTKDREQKLADILTRYPTKMAALIPLLHLCQEQNGFISEDVMTYCAHKLDVSPAHPEEGILEMSAGQSGHFLSPNFADQQADWLAGTPAPFLAGPAVSRIVLVP